MTAPHGRIADIEVLRAAAILMVMVEHMSINLLYWHGGLLDFTTDLWRGAAGVDLFFTISGFVIARALLPRLAACHTGTAYLAESLTFLVRRFWRLQPAAWLWLALPIAPTVLFNASGAFHTLRANLSAGLACLLAFNNLRNAQITEGWAMGIYFPYWSLSLEEQFYALLPVLALMFRRRLVWALLALVAYQFTEPFVQALIVTRPGELAMGVLLAIWARHPAYGLLEPRALAGAAWRRLAFSGGLLALLGLSLSTLLYPLRSMAFGFAAAITGVLVYAASFDRGYIMAPGFWRGVMVWIGARSYALYLAHIPCYALAREIMFRLRPPDFTHDSAEATGLIAIGVALTFVLADASYRLVEMPCRRYGRRLRVAPALIAA
jgi:peptidoglycan/LPS O-acetylase OafA/YrhL